MASTGTPSPAVARRRVSLALRRAREAKNWTQTQVANAMEWSLSKVMRIEKGQVNISPTDLRAVLQILDVTDADEVDELLADARVSRAERYTVDESDREHLTPAMLQLSQYETVATSICIYNYVLIPAHLQTEAYARAIFEGYGSIPPSTFEARIKWRMNRRQLLHQQPRPSYEAIIDESVLLRPFGGPAVMGEQLITMLRVTRELDLSVRVLPFDAGAVVTLVGSFTFLSLGDAGEGVVYREVGLHDEMTQSRQ
jgi:transcriptional regulator with XRE-family HTH domain